MTPEEIKQRYDTARANAVNAIDDLNQGADPARVYVELEIAFLWRLAVEGGMKFRPETLSQMLEETSG